MFYSLRLKFVVYFVGLMTVSMVLLAKSLFDHEHDALLRELRKRLSVEADNLGLQAREAIETNDELTLLTTLRGLRAKEDFVYATVLLPDGTVFAHSDVRRVGRTLEVPKEAAPLLNGQAFLEGDQGEVNAYIEVWTPVLSTLGGKSERIGLVCLRVSQAALHYAVDEAKLSAIRVGALFAVLGVLGTALIAQTVTQPIGKLVYGVRRIAAGDLKYKMDLHRNDEIGLLSDSFDHMTDELQRAQRELLKQHLYEKELEVAGKIQSALLPAGPPHVEGFEVAALTVPARVVGGDFYDYLPLRNDQFAFLVADVAGKGVSAGLVMAAARSAARSAFNFTSSPREALTALNDQLLHDFDRTTFVTMLCMVLDRKHNRLAIASAGHPPLLWCRVAHRRTELVRIQGAALGVLPHDEFDSILETTEVTLDAGDLVLGYSDGVNDTHDMEGSLFGEERLLQFGNEHADLGPPEFLAALQEVLLHYAGGSSQFDDITALALKATPQRIDVAGASHDKAKRIVERRA